MSQMCPNCSHDNPDAALICAHCQESLRGLLGQNILLENRYCVIRVLGCGGMGAVYLAEDTRMPGRQVAVKENLDLKPQAQSQFRTEVSLMVGLNHTSLPNVSDQFRAASGRQYLVMDYIEGETLEERVNQQSLLQESDAVGVTKQLLNVVDYLHERQVIHRDIKPANIKLLANGKLMLVDFGLAKVHAPGHQTQTGARGAGSPGFAALEQYGSGTDKRSDVYSLGAVMYFMLTGQIPPEAPDLAAGIRLTPPRHRAPSLSVDLQSVVIKAMALNPAHRYQSITEMRQALIQAVTSSGVLPGISTPANQGGSQPLQPAGSPFKSLLGWPALAIIGLVLIALILLAGGGLAIFVIRARQPQNGATPPLVIPSSEATVIVAPTATSPTLLQVTSIPLATTTPQTSTGGTAQDKIVITSTPIGTVTRQATTPTPPLGGATAASIILFKDDFSANTQAWPTGDMSGPQVNGINEIKEGRYRQSLTFKGDVTQWVTIPGFSARDFLLTINITLVETSDSDSTGIALIFREQDVDNYYIVRFSNAGTYHIGVWRGSAWHVIQEWTESSAFDLGPGKLNTFGLQVSGENFTLFANNQTLTRVKDKTLPETGQIGLGVSGEYGDQTATVDFDNLVIEEAP